MASNKNLIGIEALLPEAIREAAINHLFELGATGVEEDSQKVPGFVRAFFPDEDARGALPQFQSYLDSALALFPNAKPVQPKIFEVAQENWAEKYKEFYQPQKMTDIFYLVPAWMKNTAKIPFDMVPIILEPGQAFGTGLHPTTLLCMLLLERTMREFVTPTSLKVLDVGTGTGILAIAAAKLGSNHVVAIDNDPIATEAAIENCQSNGVSEIKVSTAELSSLKEDFDVIVSNILLKTHEDILALYKARLKRGGYLILSGVLADQRERLNELFTEAGFIKGEESTLQEWSALVFIRSV